jgi:hypothetical protein
MKDKDNNVRRSNEHEKERLPYRNSGAGVPVDFLNPILFAICSTLSKLCVTYTVTCRRELSSAPL